MALNDPRAPKTTTTLVIGGGLAGLATATYLARGGRAVTVLERASSVGGRALTDAPHGYALNRGVHALYAGGPASEVLRELGVRYTSGTPTRIFAMDARGIHRFPGTPLGLLRTTLLDVADRRELVRVFLRLPSLRLTDLAHQSCADWIARAARRARVRQLLSAVARVYTYSAALDLVSADVFLGRLLQTARHPVHYVDGGWQTLVDGLREAALAAGVRLVTSAGVSSVEVHGGSVRRVRLQDGAELEGDELVLAVAPSDALRLIGAPLEPVLADRLPARVACLDLALEQLPRPEHPVVFDLDRPLFVTAQSEFARLAPRDGAVVHAVKLLDPRRTSDPHQDLVDLEGLMDRVQPGWRRALVERRFLPRMLAAGVVPLAGHGGLAGRAEYRLEAIANLYFAGDWVGPRGFLADASLDSARAVARLILQAQPARAGARSPVAAAAA
jgi:phytoene dehydrogenase-like protein